MKGSTPGALFLVYGFTADCAGSSLGWSLPPLLRGTLSDQVRGASSGHPKYQGRLANASGNCAPEHSLRTSTRCLLDEAETQALLTSSCCRAVVGSGVPPGVKPASASASLPQQHSVNG